MIRVNKEPMEYMNAMSTAKGVKLNADFKCGYLDGHLDVA